MTEQIISAIEEASAIRSNLKGPSEKDPNYRFRGTRVPILRSITKQFKKEFLQQNVTQRVTIIDELIKTGMAEEQLIAISLMAFMPTYFRSPKMKQLDGWLNQLHGWSLIDHLSVELIRLLQEQDRPLMYQWIDKWSTSRNYWKRRLSAVAFVRKIAGQKSFHPKALEVCERLAYDKEDMVQKGVGWCMQDLMRTGEPAVLKSLKKMQKKGASSTVILFSLRKSDPELKKSVLAGK